MAVHAVVSRLRAHLGPPDPDTSRPATYEGRTVQPDVVIAEIAARARAHVAMLKSESLGVILDTPITLDGNPESALANLFTDAMLSEIDADVAIHNVSGGIRSILSVGELTFGKVIAAVISMQSNSRAERTAAGTFL